MTIPSATEQLVAQQANLHRKLVTDTGALAGSLKPGSIKNFDFDAFVKLFDKFSTLNDDLVAATDSSNGRFFNTSSGKVIHAGVDVGGIVVGLGGAAFIIKTYIDNPNIDPTMIKAALASVAALIIKCVKDLWRNYQENKALAVANNPPENPDKLKSIKEVVQSIQTLATTTGPAAAQALAIIQQHLSKMPSRQRKQFDAHKLGQLAKLAMIRGNMLPPEGDTASTVPEDDQTRGGAPGGGQGGITLGTPLPVQGSDDEGEAQADEAVIDIMPVTL